MPTIADDATMTPQEAMDDLHRAIGMLAGVRAWLMRHEQDMSALTARDAHRLASAQWCGWQAGEALTHASDEIVCMDMRVFGNRK